MGVWMAGAEATAAYGSGFRRSERPGTYDLIVRNVGWMKDNAANIQLSQDQIDDLFANLNTDPGLPFYSIQNGLQQIRDSWRDELQNQPPIYQVFALTDANFSDIVVQSDLPILVVFGPRFNPQTATLIKRIEGMVPHYAGKAKFGTAEPQTCPKIYQKEKILKPPLVRLYKKGLVAGELKGEMNEEAIMRLIDDNISSTGLLGIEMQTPTTHHLHSQIFPRTIHVYVALCDNEHQSIVPVPPELGNGKDPKNNLFWGALYGVKTYFKKSKDWRLVASIQSPKYEVLERCVFKHRAYDVFLVADAYRGDSIKRIVVDFLESASGNKEESLVIKIDSRAVSLNIGGKAQLIVYVGHNGLMDYNLDNNFLNEGQRTREAIVLACNSKSYFKEPLQKAGAHPLLWTTGLLTAEAYTLKGVIDGWILEESGEKIRERAAQAYNRYQKCGLKAGKRLLVTGW